MLFYLSNAKLDDFGIPATPEESQQMVENRRSLVGRYNELIGHPSEETRTAQTKFINGDVTYQEIVAFVRYYEYMVYSAQRRPD